MAFLTACCSPISSSQRFTFGNSSISIFRVAQLDAQRIADHIGNRVLAGSEIALVEQTEVHYSEDAMRFIVEAAKGVGKIAVVSALGGASEMALLAELRTLIGQLPADPLSDIVFVARVLRVELSGLLGEIHHDRL